MEQAMENHTGHDHSGGENHNHSHSQLRILSRKKLWIALAINASFLVLEFIGGLVANSLALLADAGHMLTDVTALGLAIFVAILAEKRPTPTRTYGLVRAEVLGAFVNGAALVVIVGVNFWQAWERIGRVPEINSALMVVVASLGLAANLASAWILYGSRNQTVNMRAAFLHMTADALGSVGAITAGVVIMLTGWSPIDPIASIVIGGLILWSTGGLLVQTVNILLESTPENIDYNKVEKAILDVPHVKDIHDLHIWTIASGIPALSAHITLLPDCTGTCHWQNCLKDIRVMLAERFGIEHSTLQIEPEEFIRDNHF
jgi:cobalt-zinc-cadmium efflux system protein